MRYISFSFSREMRFYGWCVQGAFWGLMVGLVMGITRFAWESAYPPVLCGEEAQDKRPAVIKDVHYLHFGMLLFAVVVVTTVVVSLLTKPIDDKHVSLAAGCSLRLRCMTVGTCSNCRSGQVNFFAGPVLYRITSYRCALLHHFIDC